jgi:Tfp pilus assembly protein PilF
MTAKAQAASGDEGSQAWYLAQSNRGEQLLDASRVAEAAQVFRAILTAIGEAPSHQRAITLARLGRCFGASGRPDLAVKRYREGLEVAAQLEQSDLVKHLQGTLHHDLADVLRESGLHGGAREEYEASLVVDEERGDLRNKAATLGQIGTLALEEGKLDEALTRNRAALALFQQLGEPAMEAVGWHQLGRVFEKAQEWEHAERHYRESARIKEEIGDVAGAAITWAALALVSEKTGKPQAAESWYRKAIEAGRAHGDLLNVSRALCNFADFLKSQPGRLSEARQLAEEALALARTIDPAAAQTWNAYINLAKLAEKEAALTPEEHRQAELQAEAREHRRLGREVIRKFPGVRYALQKHLPLILATATATQDPAQQGELASVLNGYSNAGWNKLVSAVQRIVGGERDSEALIEDLDFEDSLIVETILAALADPSSLSDLLPEAPKE